MDFCQDFAIYGGVFTWRLHLEWFLYLILVPIFSEKGLEY